MGTFRIGEGTHLPATRAGPSLGTGRCARGGISMSLVLRPRRRATRSAACVSLPGDDLRAAGRTRAVHAGDTRARSQATRIGTRVLCPRGPFRAIITGDNDGYIKLYHMGARWYDSELGRWTSPDTIIPDPNNPQTLNRFAYAGNNPVR